MQYRYTLTLAGSLFSLLFSVRVPSLRYYHCMPSLCARPARSRSEGAVELKGGSSVSVAVRPRCKVAQHKRRGERHRLVVVICEERVPPSATVCHSPRARRIAARRTGPRYAPSYHQQGRAGRRERQEQPKRRAWCWLYSLCWIRLRTRCELDPFHMQHLRVQLVTPELELGCEVVC